MASKAGAATGLEKSEKRGIYAAFKVTKAERATHFLAPRNLGRALSPPRDGQTAGAPSGRQELYVCPLPLLAWSKLDC